MILVILKITLTIKPGKEEVKNENVKILEVKSEEEKTTYTVTSKGWGLIKANVEVVNKKITAITILDSSGETQWSEIENANYLNKIIENQNNIDNLDAVSGSTKTSNGLKNIVKAITEEENEK